MHSSVRYLELPNVIEELSLGMLESTLRLNRIIFPEAYLSIRESALFGAFTDLEEGEARELVVPETCTSIGDNAFASSSLSSITVPGTVSEILTDTFQNIWGLQYIILEEGVESIAKNAFDNFHSYEEGFEFQEIHFPSSLTFIHEEVFGSYFSADDLMETQPELKFHVTQGSYAHRWLIDFGINQDRFVLLLPN